MSGWGYPGAQQGGGGRGGGLFDMYGSAWLGGGRGAQSGHGGFRGGGGGGGGERPWRGGGGPQGHRYEDPRRDGRIQKNNGRGGGGGRGRGGRGRGGRGRGGARGGGRGRGQAKANEPSWDSDKHYQKKDTGARERVEGVNYDAQMNTVRAEGAPLVKDAMSAVDNRHRDRLRDSQADQFEAADPKTGDFLGINLEARNARSLFDRADRTAPEGTRWNVRLKRVLADDGPLSVEAAKEQFYSSMLTTADPFAFDPDQEDEVPPADGMNFEYDKPPRRSADEQVDEEHRAQGARNPHYKDRRADFTRHAEDFKDA